MRFRDRRAAEAQHDAIPTRIIGIEKLSHGHVGKREAELRIRLPEELDYETRDTYPARKNRRWHPDNA